MSTPDDEDKYIRVFLEWRDERRTLAEIGRRLGVTRGGAHWMKNRGRELLRLREEEQRRWVRI